jgi:hypothetical protein
MLVLFRVACAFLGLVVMLGLFGCSKQSDGSSSERSSGSVQSSSAVESRNSKSSSKDDGKTADVSMSADEYLKAWLDGLDPKARFKGKVIEITGEVNSVQELETTGLLGLSVKDPKMIVKCETVDKRAWLKVCRGSRVTIRGVNGDERITLVKAEIVSAGPNPGISVSAEQLGKEFAECTEEVKGKYKDKPLYVEGQVVEVGEKGFTLKGSGGRDVHCRFLIFPRPKLGDLKAGSKVKLPAEFADCDIVLTMNATGLIELPTGDK